jgi:hypothetical protein
MTITHYLISIFTMTIGVILIAAGLLVGAIVWSGKPIEFTTRNDQGRVVALTPADGDRYYSYARNVIGGAAGGGGLMFLIGWWMKRRIDTSPGA